MPGLGQVGDQPQQRSQAFTKSFKPYKHLPCYELAFMTGARPGFPRGVAS
jgi:hypothetical protein